MMQPAAVIVAALALLAGRAPTPAQAAEGEPRLVRVPLGGAVTAGRVIEAGLDVIEFKRDGALLVLAWPGDEAKLAALGAAAILVDEAPGRTAAARTRAELGRMAPPRRGSDRGVTTAPPFGAGSLGGFWTVQEIKAKLDDLVANDAHDVVADTLDSLGTTVQGRTIWGLRLGLRRPGPETRPVAFFNALTHAREPEGMQALFYFVDDLLAGYGVDPFATYLLDERVVYVVPLVNPDGYQRNQDTYTASGGTSFGSWRKNLRDNDGNGTINSNDGVDINRNFGFKWGLDNVGSSGSISAGNYRGPSAFSEPETRAQRDVVARLDPSSGLSFHTYSDLLLHPWGYTPAATADSAAFYELNDEMTPGSGYQSGQGTRVLYAVNGEFNDWCYGDTIAKPRAWTWTPEVGGPSDGFWPPPSRIVPLAAANLRSCYTVAAAAGAWVRVERASLSEPFLNAGFGAHLTVRARNRGRGGPAGPGLIATLTSLSAGARVVAGTVGYPSIAPRSSAEPNAGESFEIAADDTVTPGRRLRFRVDFSAPDGFFSRDTVEILCGTPTVLLADDADAGLAAWSSNGWGVESLDPAHPGPYFTESVGANYPSSTNRFMVTKAPVDLSAGVHAYASFQARWMFESDYDAGLVEASLDSVSWTPLAGTGTSLGVSGGVQPVGAPVYDGTRHARDAELVDLSAFAGPTATAVRFRLRVVSDVGAQFDGFAVDSLRIVVYDPEAQPLPVAVGDGVAPRGLALAAPRPNPSRGSVRFEFDLPRAGSVRLELFDVHGRRVRLLADGWLAADRYVRGWDGRDDAGRSVAGGLYVARLTSGDKSRTQRVVVLP